MVIMVLMVVIASEKTFVVLIVVLNVGSWCLRRYQYFIRATFFRVRKVMATDPDLMSSLRSLSLFGETTELTKSPLARCGASGASRPSTIG
jgi:hypothetical protein